jgi:2'-5' RNA ligase
MADYREHHATIFLPPDVAESIEAARATWDPDMAKQIAAHITLAYPQEAPNAGLLVERIREASGGVGPFRLRLGDVGCFERPEDGVYIDVEDIDGGYRTMREQVLRPPFHRLEFPPHVTIVHARTSRRAHEFWGRAAYRPQRQEFVAREIAITAFDGARWTALATYRLAATRGR